MLCTREAPRWDTLLPTCVRSYLTSASGRRTSSWFIVQRYICPLHSSGTFHFYGNRSLDQVLESWPTAFWETFSLPTGSYTTMWLPESNFFLLGHSESTFLDPLFSDMDLYWVLASGMWMTVVTCISLLSLAHKSLPCEIFVLFLYLQKTLRPSGLGNYRSLVHESMLDSCMNARQMFMVLSYQNVEVLWHSSWLCWLGHLLCAWIWGWRRKGDGVSLQRCLQSRAWLFRSMTWRKFWLWVEGSSSAMRTRHVTMTGKGKREDRRGPG